MKKILYALAVQLVMTLAVQAQFDLPESRYLSQLRSKTLLVALADENTSTLIQLQNKPDQLKAYKDGIARYNQWLKEAVEKYWKQGKGVEYMPRIKADQQMAAGNSKYVELTLEEREGDLVPIMFAKIYGMGPYNNEVRQESKDAGFGVYRLKFPVKGKDPEIIYSVFLPVAYPSQGDMVYTMRMMNDQIQKATKDRTYQQVKQFEDDVKKNNKLLKSKTLLISSTQMDNKSTIDDLRKAYSGTVQLVDYEKINEAIVNEDSAYAYVMVVPGGEKGTKVNAPRTPIIHLVIDAATNEVLATTIPNRMEYGKLQTDISKKEIKDYINK